MLPSAAMTWLRLTRRSPSSASKGIDPECSQMPCLCAIAWSAEGQGLSASRVICPRSEEHTSELQSLMRISYAVVCLKKQYKKPSSQTNKRMGEEQDILRK